MGDEFGLAEERPDMLREWLGTEVVAPLTDFIDGGEGPALESGLSCTHYIFIMHDDTSSDNHIVQNNKDIRVTPTWHNSTDVSYSPEWFG